MQDDKLIITVEQVRQLAKGSLDGKSDAEIEQHITELDFLAKLFLKGVVASKGAVYKQEE